MERDLAGALLNLQDFWRLQRCCRADPKFPSTYQAWTALVSLGTSDLLAEHSAATEQEIDVDDFIGWCGRLEIEPSLDALRAYLIVQRRRTGSAASPSMPLKNGVRSEDVTPPFDSPASAGA